MKNQNYSSKLTTLLLAAFAFVFLLSTAREASAQRYLSEIRAANEANGIIQFADELSEFLNLAQFIEQDNLARPLEIKRLEAAGKKVKDGTSNLRSNLKGLIAKLKSQNLWDEQLDKEINDALGGRRVKGFFQRNGGRKILTDAETAINAVNSDVDTIINNAKNRTSGSVSFGDGHFTKAAFAPAASARKVSFRCVVLGVGIFIAEIKKAPKTAENLDQFFDKNCGAGANTAT